MDGFIQSLKSLGATRLTVVVGSGVAVLAFIIYMLARISSQPLEMLYGNLSLVDSGQIVKELQTQKEQYELRAGGAEIWVPANEVLDERVRLAEEQLPSGGGSLAPGYELFDKSDVLGSTSFMQDVNLVRAMEGELARTISSLDGVASARVHLVLPRREMFSTTVEQASASILLKMNTGKRLDPNQVKAVQHLVASAVPQLEPQRISIVDDHGTLLARGNETDSQQMIEDNQDLKLSTEQRLQRTIENLIEQSVGPDRVRAEVSVDMDFDRIATTQESFDPDSKVVRSEVTTQDNNQSQDAENSTVSVTQNLPDASSNNPGATSTTKQGRNEDTVNYEISKTTRNQVKDTGTIQRISAAVMVDGTYGPPAPGVDHLTYQPLDQKTIDQITALVQHAIGYNQQRGDQVQVVNMPFAGHDEIEPSLEASKLFGIDRDVVVKIAQNLGLSVVAILFLLLVLRPLVSRAVETMGGPIGPDGRRLAPGGAGQGLLAAGEGPPVPSLGMLEEMESVDELIDIDKIEGRVKASSIRKIGEIVDKHPEEALAIIRTWMFSES